MQHLVVNLSTNQTTFLLPIESDLIAEKHSEGDPQRHLPVHREQLHVAIMLMLWLHLTTLDNEF